MKISTSTSLVFYSATQRVAADTSGGSSNASTPAAPTWPAISARGSATDRPAPSAVILIPVQRKTTPASHINNPLPPSPWTPSVATTSTRSATRASGARDPGTRYSTPINERRRRRRPRVDERPPRDYLAVKSAPNTINDRPVSEIIPENRCNFFSGPPPPSKVFFWSLDFKIHCPRCTEKKNCRRCNRSL